MLFVRISYPSQQQEDDDTGKRCTEEEEEDGLVLAETFVLGVDEDDLVSDSDNDSNVGRHGSPAVAVVGDDLASDEHDKEKGANKEEQQDQGSSTVRPSGEPPEFPLYVHNIFITGMLPACGGEVAVPGS